MPWKKGAKHPLARAIFAKAEEEKLIAGEISDFKALPGNGLSAVMDNVLLCGGNFNFISSHAPVTPEMKAQSEQLAEEGKTPLFFSMDSQMIGIIAVADTIKEDSPQAVRELKDMASMWSCLRATMRGRPGQWESRPVWMK